MKKIFFWDTSTVPTVPDLQLRGIYRPRNRPATVPATVPTVPDLQPRGIIAHQHCGIILRSQRLQGRKVLL